MDKGKCPVCGFNNPPSRERCVRCSAQLGAGNVTSRWAREEGTLGRAGESVQRTWQTALQRAFRPFRHARLALARRFEASIPTGMPHRFPWTSAYLALLLGAGHWYNGQPVKAVFQGCVQGVLLAAAAVTFFEPYNNWVLLTALAWSLLMMADAFSTAVRINGQVWHFRLVLAVWSSLFFFVGITLFGLQFFGYGVFNLTTVRSAGMGPQLERGDKVFVLHRGFFRRPIGPGDVVYFRRERPFFVERPGSLFSTHWSVREQTAFGVVTATGGQTINRDQEDGRITVDGEAVPPALLPVNPDGYPHGWRVQVPEGRNYGIPHTHGVVDRGLINLLYGPEGQSMTTPREIMAEGMILRDYESSAVVHHHETFGVVLFRYHPPERRQWFGRRSGLWRENPENYP